MRTYSWEWAMVLSAALLPLGCSDTSTTGTTRTTERKTTTTTHEAAPAPATQPNGNIDIDAGPNAADRTAGNDRGGVDVDVDLNGGPIRERIRERRAARDTGIPR